MNLVCILLFTFIVSVFSFGEYIPQKDKFGQLLPKQCWGSTGLCWCVYEEEKRYFREENKICIDKRKISN